MSKPGLLWFRKDLRLHDNPVLHRALDEADALLPVYCLDPRWFRELPLGFRKTGAHRSAFLLQSLHDLRERLQRIGGDLHVVIGQPEEVLPRLIRAHDIKTVYAQRDIAREEREDEEAVRQAIAPLGCEFVREWSHLLYHPDDVAFSPEDTAATSLLLCAFSNGQRPTKGIWCHYRDRLSGTGGAFRQAGMGGKAGQLILLQ